MQSKKKRFELLIFPCREIVVKMFVFHRKNNILLFKDDRTGQNKHELLQYSFRTINNSTVSRITYPRKMHALYEKRV